MARNGNRPVTETLLEAHLQPMRDDIRQLVNDQRAFAQFMTGAVSSAALQENIRKSRHFWIGVAVSMTSIACGALIVLLSAH